jgi:hypothetical protein
MKTWRRSAAEPQVKLLGMINDRSWKGSDLHVMDSYFNVIKYVYSCLFNINEIILSEFPALMDAMLRSTWFVRHVIACPRSHMLQSQISAEARDNIDRLCKGKISSIKSTGLPL